MKTFAYVLSWFSNTSYNPVSNTFYDARRDTMNIKTQVLI